VAPNTRAKKCTSHGRHTIFFTNHVPPTPPPPPGPRMAVLPRLDWTLASTSGDAPPGKKRNTWHPETNFSQIRDRLSFFETRPLNTPLPNNSCPVCKQCPHSKKLATPCVAAGLVFHQPRQEYRSSRALPVLGTFGSRCPSAQAVPVFLLAPSFHGITGRGSGFPGGNRPSEFPVPQTTARSLVFRPENPGVDHIKHLSTLILQRAIGFTPRPEKRREAPP